MREVAATALERGYWARACFPQCDASDEALRAFAPLTQLTELDVSFSGVSIAGCLEIACLPGLTHLSLESCARVSDKGVQNLFEGLGLRHLKRLNLLGCPVGNCAMVHVARLRDLADLSLASSEITNAGIAEFIKEYCKHHPYAALLDRSQEVAKRSYGRLTRLDLAGCRGVDQWGLEFLNELKLEELHVPNTCTDRTVRLS